MYFFKTFISSFINSFKVFWNKELLELLYFSYASLGQIYSNLKVILLHALILAALLFTKPNSLAFIVLFWFLHFDCLSFLRPSVDHKNYKYFLSYLLVAIKILSFFLLIIYLPYSVLHTDLMPLTSLTFVLFLVLFILFAPFKFSLIKIVSGGILSFLCMSIFIGFKSLVHHLLLMGYLNFEYLLNWILYIFMFDKQLFDVVGFVGFFLSPVMIFIVLSMLDSRKTFFDQLAGLKRGLKMFLLNYPISFIWFNLFRILIVYAYKYFFMNGLFNNLWLILLFVFFYYFYLSFLTNIYVKKVHEQFLTYF